MKKRFSVIAAMAFALSIFTAGCTGENLPPKPQAPKKETAVPEKKDAPKSSMKLFTGTIVALDETAGTLTLKGPKGAMDFQAREKVKKQLDGLKIGDKVIVKHIDEIALAIVKRRTSDSAPPLEEKKVPSGEIDPSPSPPPPSSSRLAPWNQGMEPASSADGQEEKRDALECVSPEPRRNADGLDGRGSAGNPLLLHHLFFLTTNCQRR